METSPVSPSQQVKRSEAQLKPIDAIYTLDDYLEPCGVRPVASVRQSLPFDPDISYRVYFEHTDTPDGTDSDDLPHADIFIQSDGELCVDYDFLPTATLPEVESLELVMKTLKFQRSALQRWGGFTLHWGGPGSNGEYADGANMLAYYDDEIAFVTLRRVGVPSPITFAQLLDDYLFLRDVVSRMTKKISNPLDTPDQEEDINPHDNDVDTEDDDPSFLYDWINPT